MTIHSNIILIGMPGCGKSSVGVLLAKKLGLGFIDTDLIIQQSSGKRLQEIIEDQGFMALRQIEERILMSLTPIQHVIATGGSAIYSKKGMQNLKSLGKVFYLQLSLEELKKRVGDYSERGIASDANTGFEAIYNERCPLYQSFADTIVECEGLSTEQVVEKIIDEANAPN